jgi:hypothetical protein
MAGTSRDLYMQFKDISVALNASDSSYLVTDEMDTGLSIRGQLVWLIHLIEVFFQYTTGGSGAQVINFALSTVADLAALPALGDKGCLIVAQKEMAIATNGISYFNAPQQLKYLPPIPLAAPNLSIYAQTTADVSTLRSTTIKARLGFTTAPLDNAMYTEIAEVWGW